MMYYSVMTQANSGKEIPSAPIWSRKVLSSTPDRSTRNFFFRVCLCHYWITHHSHLFTRLKIVQHISFQNCFCSYDNRQVYLPVVSLCLWNSIYIRTEFYDKIASEGLLSKHLSTAQTPHSRKYGKTATSEGWWDRLGRRIEIAPMNNCISRQSVV